MKKKLLSQKFYETLKLLEPRYPTKKALLLPALHAAQDEWGWLPPEVLDEIGNYIDIHPAQVVAVASFYSLFHLKPVGKHQLKFCTNVACCLRGSDQLIQHCEKKLGIARGETTADRTFTILEEECLGACDTAPVMLLNQEYQETMDIFKLDHLIESLKSK